MLADVDGPTEVLNDALGEALFETLDEVMGDMLTDALVETLADTLVELLVRTSDLVAPNNSKHCLVSFSLATPTQGNSVQDLDLYVTNRKNVCRDVQHTCRN